MMTKSTTDTKRLDVPLLVKAISEDGTFSGYGSVFNVEDRVGDIVAPGAFEKSLEEWAKKGRLPALLWMHDSSQPIGIYTEMREDAHGLYVEGKLLKGEVKQAAEAYALLKAKAIGGLSIGYRVKREEWDNDTFIRTLKEVELWEVSLVTFPANPDAQVSTVKQIKTIREFEAALRDEFGFSHAQAKAVASRGFKAAAEHRDDDAGLGDSLARISRVAQSLKS